MPGPAICLSLTGSTLEENYQLLDRWRGSIDLLELRADFLEQPRLAELAAFPRRAGLPVILALRRPAEGGRFRGGESERLDLLRRLLVAGYRYVDLEEDLPAGPLDREARAASVRIIRSLYDGSGVPADLAARLERLDRRPDELIRIAVQVRGSADLLLLLQTVAGQNAPRQSAPGRTGTGRGASGSPATEPGPGLVLIGLGPYGLPIRVLAARLGSPICYCPAPGPQAAPGEPDVETLTALYRFRLLGPLSPVYGVIGNPIMHSHSPLIHNRGLAAAGLDGVYLPFQVDDLPAFFAAAALLGVRGLSVTLPHKEGVLAFLSSRDEAVQAVGACNTMVLEERGWRGANTDVAGFLEPLRARFGRPLPAGLGATVVGAGGAARAVVYALRREGARVLILNRTLSRARRLAGEFGAEAAGLDSPDLAGYDDLIVQTTSLGMAGAASGAERDPLPGYTFSGRETVCDIVYTPEVTPFLERARRAGCRIVTGREMFVAQARDQFRLFTGHELPENAVRL